MRFRQIFVIFSEYMNFSFWFPCIVCIFRGNCYFFLNFWIFWPSSEEYITISYWFYSIMSRKARKLLSPFLLDLFLIFVYILTENIIAHKDIQRQFYRQFGKSPQTSRVLGNKGNENSSSWCWASPFDLRYFKWYLGTSR